MPTLAASADSLIDPRQQADANADDPATARLRGAAAGRVCNGESRPVFGYCWIQGRPATFQPFLIPRRFASFKSPSKPSETL